MQLCVVISMAVFSDRFSRLCCKPACHIQRMQYMEFVFSRIVTYLLLS